MQSLIEKSEILLYLLGNINDNFETVNFDALDISGLPELEQIMLHKIFILNDNFRKYFNNYDFQFI